MKAWFTNDPFLEVTVKLMANKEQFTKFLKNQYDIKGNLQLDYKRNNQVAFPETVDQTVKRFKNFYKSLVEKYFNLGDNKHLERSRVVICVTHGVPAHNPFLHLFEADKDVVYLDYSAVTVIEKAFMSGGLVGAAM